MKSILLYRQTINFSLSPNEFTTPFLLSACASKSAYWVFVLVHSHVQKLDTGFHICLLNSLINAYVTCGFTYMRELGVEPDEFTIVNLFSVWSQGYDIDLGKFVSFFTEITRLKIDLIARNYLLDVYAKCGLMQSTERVF
ncbi:hypothetical protein P3X46_012418 [Hevea brasiliensis]|uniref:Pentatricopeptide repeat-containing protein n=1 Tax=Hevea brasiliensis TaxID=3981 RepID=A0ABQ9MCK3_HEVBR|nr:hypothetical protein P3X46_012418 [Hevea brasiliensis]